MGEIAPPEEQFHPLSTIFYYLISNFYVKTGIRFFLRDKRLFEITEVEITRVDCISKGAVYAMVRQFSMTLQIEILATEPSDFLKQIIFLRSFNSVLYVRDRAWFVRLYREIIPEL